MRLSHKAIKVFRRTQMQISILFIPFDAGGTHRTKTGLQEKQTLGTMYPKIGGSYYQMPPSSSTKIPSPSQFQKVPSQSMMMYGSRSGGLPTKQEEDLPLMSKSMDGKQKWDFSYDGVVAEAIGKLGSKHDRDLHKKSFSLKDSYLGKGKYFTCDSPARSHTYSKAKIPNIYPEIIFLSEESSNLPFPTELNPNGVKYLQAPTTAGEGKQKISVYCRENFLSLVKVQVEAKQTDQGENSLIIRIITQNAKLSIAGVHFSAKNVSKLKYNPKKSGDTLKDKMTWCSKNFINALIGDFNFDCSQMWDYEAPVFVDGVDFMNDRDSSMCVEEMRFDNTSQKTPQRFMNAICVFNSKVTTNPKGTTCPLKGYQSTSTGFYSDHPWIYFNIENA